MDEYVEYIKKHWMLVLAVVGGIVFLFILKRAGSGSSGASTGLDPTTAALYAQESQTSAAQQGQQAQLSASLQNSQIEAQYGLDLATIQGSNAQNLATTQANAGNYQTYAALQLGTDNLSTQLAETQQAAGVQIANITAQSADIANEISASENIANLTAQEQLGIANEQGQVAIAESNNTTQVGIAQTNAVLGVAQTNASVAKTISNNQLTGQIVTGAFSALGSFF